MHISNFKYLKINAVFAILTIFTTLKNLKNFMDMVWHVIHNIFVSAMLLYKLYFYKTYLVRGTTNFYEIYLVIGTKKPTKWKKKFLQ